MSDSGRVLLLSTVDTEGMRWVLQAATRTGFRVEHAAANALRVCGTGAELSVWKLGEPLAAPDVVVHTNIRVIDPLFGLLEAWERNGVAVLNPTRVGHAAVNKWSQQDLFAQARIPHPHTELVTEPAHVYQFAEQHGYPFVVKPAHGGAALGLLPVGEYRHIRERVEPTMDGRTGLVLQQLVSFRGATGRSRDRKAVVVGGRIVTVMERTGPPGEIAASRHGREEHVDLATLRPEEMKYLPAAADAMGVALGSVDYWLTDDHPEGLMVNEVNPFPGLPPREAAPFADAVVALIGERIPPKVASPRKAMS